MKPVIFLFCAVLALTNTNAQKKKPVQSPPPVEVPENVNATFKNQFAVAENGQWKKTYKGNFIATFTNADSRIQSVEYDALGAFVKSKISYHPADLPAVVTSAITQYYSGLKVTDCLRIEIPGIKPFYKLKIANSDNIEKEILISEEGTVSE